MIKQYISASRHYPKEALISWINEQGCTHALTLTFNKQVHIQKAKAQIGDLIYRFDKKLLGRKAYKFPSHKRSFFIAFPEHISSNIHYHAALRLAKDVSVPAAWMKNTGYEFLDTQWKKITKYSGDVKVEEIISGGWSHYITKELAHNDRVYSGTDFILANDYHSDNTLEKNYQKHSKY